MLRKTGYVVLAVVVLAALVGVVYAQGGRGGMGPAAGARGPGMGGGMGAGGGMMMERLGLTAPEKAAVAKAMDQKQRSRQSLRTELDRLRTVAERKEATNAELKTAVAEYLAVRDRVAKSEALADQTLMKSLSPRAQANCLTAGIVSNGLGFGGGMEGGRRGGGMRGAGGMGPMPGMPE